VRTAALERALNATLFERTAGGYKLTPLGSALVTQAERAEAGAEAFGRQAVNGTANTTGLAANVIGTSSRRH
jgi:DNA-binding transcriptional LysR family regulator